MICRKNIYIYKAERPSAAHHTHKIVNGLVGEIQAPQQIVQRDKHLMITGKTKRMRGDRVILAKMEPVQSACQASSHW